MAKNRPVAPYTEYERDAMNQAASAVRKALDEKVTQELFDLLLKHHTTVTMACVEARSERTKHLRRPFARFFKK